MADGKKNYEINVTFFNPGDKSKEKTPNNANMCKSCDSPLSKIIKDIQKEHPGICFDTLLKKARIKLNQT